MIIMIIDAQNTILGRIATQAAKQALLGEKVDVINCEKAVISGTQKAVFGKYNAAVKKGIPLKGPYFPKQPDRFVRRAIRGMLPHKQPKGKDAFKRVMCHVGVPKGFEGKEMAEIKNAQRKDHVRYMTVGRLCQLLGGTS
ncbi:MAG: 50S ribosomal protein L13 [Nanoarchaeota archaeon]